jgi:hypothetical protein
MAAAIMVAFSCAPVGHYPPVPQGLNAWGIFDEEGRDAWLIFDADVSGRASRDLLGSFQVSARDFGCVTGTGGNVRGSAAILAECDEGTIVMAAIGYERVRLACLKPTTRDQCEALLGQISTTR